MIEKLKNCFINGSKKGFSTGIWMAKMTIIITLVISLLKYLGIIEILSSFLSPFFKIVGLSAEGVLVFITACFSNLYAAIAVMATLNIDFRSATILAVMGLICHNIIIETLIQKKAGSNPIFIVILRVSAALLAAFFMNIILPVNFFGKIIVENSLVQSVGFFDVIEEWFLGMLKLIPYMFLLIVSLNILQQILREFDLIKFLIKPLHPLMKIFGLSKDCSFLWLILNTLGLAYGGSILISEVNDLQISKTEARLINTHAAINHSLLEDTLLFFAIGIGVFWLVIPRIIIAIVAVWSQRLYFKLIFMRKNI